MVSIVAQVNIDGKSQRDQHKLATGAIFWPDSAGQARSRLSWRPTARAG